MATEDQLDRSLNPNHTPTQVSLVVYGSKGAIGPIELGEEVSANKFSPGTIETFKVNENNILIFHKKLFYFLKNIFIAGYDIENLF